MSERISVQVNTEVRALVPRFLANRRRELHELDAAVASGNFEAVRAIGHNLKGSAPGYGFGFLAKLGNDLHEAAVSSDRAGVQRLRRDLADFLKRVEVSDLPDAGTPPQAVVPVPQGDAQGCILLVEEHETSRLLLRRALESAGYSVECVASADEALVRIGRYPNPILVLLDATMTSSDGFDVCRRIKNDPACLEVPVILVTGVDSRADRVRGLEAGADDLLSMPVHREVLLARVRSLQRLSDARRALEHGQVVRQIEEHEHLRRMFERYVPPKLVNMILSRKEDAEALLSKRSRTDAVVLFTDLRGFTRMSEALPPDTVVDLLNEFFAALTQVAHEHEGTIFNMTGDGLLIGFNVPVPQSDAGGRAVRAASEMLQSFRGMAQAWKEKHGVDAALGIGINRGDVVVGNVGSQNYMNFTVIGDTVNVAARLVQHAGRDEILLTGAVLGAIAKGLPESALEALPPVTVKGKTAPLEVYRVHADRIREFEQRGAPANPRVLIMDDSEDFRLLASRYVLIAWPGARIEEWDPVAKGKPGSDFAWESYDVLLLDYQLGPEDGLAWLGEFRRNAKCPPVIFLTGAGNESLAARAIKEGAAEYLSKLDLSRTRLVEAMAAAMSDRAADARTLRLELTAVEGEGVRPISGYQILRKIGHGGMAEVYLALRLRDRMPIVLKMLSSKLRDDERHIARFARESGYISRMGGPYVATIYDQCFTQDCPYIAMEYFAGGDLKQRLGPALPRELAVRYLVEIAWALDYVHGSEVIHRDLKPHNVMFRENGSLALVDFGVSKAIADEAGLTRHGEIVGTPRYMSPECCRGDKVDQRHDLYSLGCIFYEMLSGGKPPFEGDTALELVYKHLRAPIPLLESKVEQYQPVLDKLLAKEPGERYPSARALIDDVKTRFPDIAGGIESATVPAMQAVAG